jgi:hypothetical protein
MNTSVFNKNNLKTVVLLSFLAGGPSKGQSQGRHRKAKYAGSWHSKVGGPCALKSSAPFPNGQRWRNKVRGVIELRFNRW